MLLAVEIAVETTRLADGQPTLPFAIRKESLAT